MKTEWVPLLIPRWCPKEHPARQVLHQSSSITVMEINLLNQVYMKMVVKRVCSWRCVKDSNCCISAAEVLCRPLLSRWMYSWCMKLCNTSNEISNFSCLFECLTVNRLRAVCLSLGFKLPISTWYPSDLSADVLSVVLHWRAWRSETCPREWRTGSLLT